MNLPRTAKSARDEKGNRLKAERFEQFTLGIDLLQKSVKQLKSYYAPHFGVKGVHTFWVYLLLSNPEGMTAAELAARSMIDRSLVSREIEELEKNGFVSAEGGGRRGYNRRITLTEKGRDAAQKIAAVANRVQENADRGIAPDELEIFYRTMEKLCENFTAISAMLAGNEETQRAFYADTTIKETKNEQQKA